MASNAVGGLLFHGVQGAASRWVHDVAILAVLLFIAVFALAGLRDHSSRWMLSAYTVSLAVGGVVLALLPGSTDVLSALLAIAIGGLEIADHRHELPKIRREGLSAKRLARLSVLAVLAIAATAFLVGRTGGPLCNADSAFQWHAVWHVLAAAAMALYAYGAIEPHPEMVGRSA